jgi:hypothetical protein
MVGGGTGAPSAAAAPVQRFEQAKSASEQRDAKSLVAADAAVLDEAAAAGQFRRAGVRMFQQQGARWADLRMKKDLQVYKVQAYSRSYFALLERLPELRESFAIGDQVLVAGRSVAIEVVQDARELTESEMNSITRNW